MSMHWIVIFAFLCCGYIARAGDVPEQAMQAWKNAGRSVQKGQLTIESEEKKSIDGQYERTKMRGTTLKNGSKVLGHLENFDTRDKLKDESIEIRNDKGVFVLVKASRDGAWKLVLAEPKNQRPDILEDVWTTCGFNSQYRIRRCLFQLLEDENVSFSDWEEFQDSNGKQLARFRVSTNTNGANLDRKVVVVDPSNAYRIVESESIDEKYKAMQRCQYDERDLGNCVAGDEWKVTDLSTGKVIRTEVLRTISYSKESPPDELFELSHYGVKE